MLTHRIAAILDFTVLSIPCLPRSKLAYLGTANYTYNDKCVIKFGGCMNSPLVYQTLPSFDELMDMAENNPEGFTQFKHEMCQEMILSASEEMRERLWAQQSHIDLVVGSCKNPNHANVVLMRELVSQMVKFQDVLDGDVNECDERPKAQVIPLKEWR